jgi:hypothetical protein
VPPPRFRRASLGGESARAAAAIPPNQQPAVNAGRATLTGRSHRHLEGAHFESGGHPQFIRQGPVASTENGERSVSAQFGPSPVRRTCTTATEPPSITLSVACRRFWHRIRRRLRCASGRVHVARPRHDRALYGRARSLRDLQGRVRSAPRRRRLAPVRRGRVQGVPAVWMAGRRLCAIPLWHMPSGALCGVLV